MDESEYLERGEKKLRGIFLNEGHQTLVDWESARAALREHHQAGVPHDEAVRRVFHEKVARQLFYRGEPKPPVNRPGVQTAVTPAVQEFAHSAVLFKRVTPELLAQYRGDPQKFMHVVQDLVRKVRSFEAVPLQFDHARKLYGTQTAEDVIATGHIPSSGTFGCAHACVALAASLRALGVKTWYVRTVHNWFDILNAPRGEKDFTFGNPHSVVEFILGRRRYVADPWVGGYIIPVTGLKRKHLNEILHPAELKRGALAHGKGLRGKSRWVRGADSWGIGILSFKDYTRHIGFSKETRHPPAPR
jgi:hypothetical protein